MKRKYILAIFFIAIAITFCGTATAADTNPATVNDQVTASSVQDNPIVETSSPTDSSTQNNLPDTQSDTNSQTANDQATSTTTDTTTDSSTQNNLPDTQSDTNPQTTVVSSKDPVVITFDDGFESTFTIAYPIMQQYGIVGTVYVVPSWIGAPGYLTLAELTTLHNAGWTIASHSWDHTVLTSLTSAEVTTELQSTIDWLNNNGFGDGAYYLAYPYGQYNDIVLQVVSGLGIKTARTVDWGTIDPDGTIYPYETPLNYLELPIILIRSDTTRDAWQSELDRSIAHEGTSIFLIHDIVTGTPADLETITVATFTTIIDYIHQTGVKTETIIQFYDTGEPTATADLPGGIYNTIKSVTLTAADTIDTNPLIYYSTDNGLTWNHHANTVTINLVEGITKLMYYAMDSATNKCTTQTNTYTIDTTLPTATDNLPSGIFNTLKSVTLTAADNLDTNPLIYYSTDNGLTWENQPNTVTINLVEGITKLMYYAMDSATNKCTTQTNTYTIDTTLPTATADLPGGIFNTLKSVTLTAADNLDTNPLIYYSTDNGLTWENQPNTVTINLVEGITKLMYYAMDSATNKCTTQTNTYTIDTTLPTATADLPGGIFNTLKSVTLTAADNLDTNPLIYYSTDNGLTWENQPNTVTINLVEGITKLMYYAMDSATNKCTTQTNTYTINTKMPIVTADLPGGIFNTLKSVTLTAADNLDTNPLICYSTDNGLTWNHHANTVTINLVEGKTVLMFYAVNSATNTCPTQTNTYTIDIIPPKTSSDIKSGLYNINKIVKLSMTEKGTIYFTINGKTPTTASTKYTGPITIKSTTILKYLAVDMAGNKSPVYTNTYTIDKIPPKASSNIKSGLYNTNKIVKLSMTEKGTIYFTINGKTPTTASTKYTGPITIKSTTTLKYFAVDMAGNNHQSTLTPTP